jgi:uncharacterized membrane protein YeaQ/YmgE (transglycosylase-associated protein family)
MLSAITLTIDPYQVLFWAVVVIVAGTVATRVILGRGLGLLPEILVGVGGALLGAFLLNFFGINFSVPGLPIVTDMVIAAVGALVILGALRVLGFSGKRSSSGSRD